MVRQVTVMERSHLGELPDPPYVFARWKRKDIGLVRQLSELETIDLGEQFGAAGAETAHLAGVEFNDQHANGGIEFRQGKEALIAQAGQDPALPDLGGGPDLCLVLWPPPPPPQALGP